MEGGLDPLTMVLNQMAATVVYAVRSGSDEELRQTRKALADMANDTPTISEDTAAIREFLMSLISVLDGKPIGVEGLAEPFAGVYSRILALLASPAPGDKTAAGKDDVAPGTNPNDVREFLTTLTASVMMVLKKGTDEEKSALGLKLREVEASIVKEEPEARRYVGSLANLVEGKTVNPARLRPPYSTMLERLVEKLEN